MPTRWSALSSSIIGMIDAESRRRIIHSYDPSANVWKTSRSEGTRIATRWISALMAMASTSGSGKNGRIVNIDAVGERQLRAWKSGESARSENATARA